MDDADDGEEVYFEEGTGGGEEDLEGGDGVVFAFSGALVWALLKARKRRRTHARIVDQII